MRAVKIAVASSGMEDGEIGAKGFGDPLALIIEQDAPAHSAP